MTGQATKKKAAFSRRRTLFSPQVFFSLPGPTAGLFLRAQPGGQTHAPGPISVGPGQARHIIPEEPSDLMQYGPGLGTLVPAPDCLRPRSS